MSFLKQFFTTLLAFIVGQFLFFFLAIAMIIGIIAGLASSTKEKVDVEPNTVLYLNFDYNISEMTSNNPFENFDFGTFKPSQNLGLNDILKNIKKAKDDDNIKGIFINAAINPNGTATTEAIRNQILNFKESGKFVVAYSEIMTQKAYYLASVADKIYLNPMGVVEFSGLNSELMFFKSMLEKLEVEPQIFYAGKYKSATEPLRLEKMSEANREQITEYMNGIYEHYLKKISASRSITVAQLDSIADNLLVRRANDALEHKLVDALAYYDEVIDDLKERTGKKDDENVVSISLKKYDNAESSKKEDFTIEDRIAVLYAEGDIVDGKGDGSNIGSERVARLIRKIRQDKNVKALVLRVNSPGGSALASEVILREMALAKEKFPVIVSMGDVAASGGYYIACYADTIVAQPNTITGSIGVFGILPNMQGFFKNKLGITFDNVQTGKYSGMGTVSRPLNADEKLIVQAAIDTIYMNFKTRVAEGRDMTVEQVDEVAQGRVWTGEQAQKKGLVDVLGGIDEAIAIAAYKADLKEYRLKEFPEEIDPFEKFMKNLKGEGETWYMKNQLGTFYPIWKKIQQIQNMQGVQARLPYEISIN